MPQNYVDADSLRRALFSLHGTADAMLKVWLTMKQMGLSADNGVTINTTNSEDALVRLFDYHGTDDRKKFLVPFSTNVSDLTMGHAAARSNIQTNISKFRLGTVGYKPTSYLRIEEVSGQQGTFNVSGQPGYPLGLGYGKDGFAKGEGQRVALPIRAWATWYGRFTPIPDGEPNGLAYLVSDMLSRLHIDAEERVAIFEDDEQFTVGLSTTAVSDADLGRVVQEFLNDPTQDNEPKVFNLEERRYQRRLAAVRTNRTGPRWLAGDPVAQFARARSLAGAVLLYGPPRTGKTLAVKKAVEGNGQVEFIQIHDGWGYEHLVVGLRSSGAGQFDWKEGPLVQAIRSGKKIIVLEEANRTQLSQALGEVFSLLEPVYRGEANQIRLRSGAMLWVPADVLFVFTMNTLDNSTDEIDDALLGRVAAIEFLPRVEDLRSMLVQYGFTDRAADPIVELFAGIQQKYPLGHGYFAGLKPDSDVREYYRLFVRPVLQKHFRHRPTEIEELDLLADEVLVARTP